MPFHQNGWQMLRTILLLFLIPLFAAVSSAQIKDKEYKISARDKAEVQRLAKHLVKRMQQTRDLTPLIPEFFVPDFDLYLQRDTKVPSWVTRRQYLRYWIALVNIEYMSNLSWKVGNSGDLSNILPKDLANSLDDKSDSAGDLTRTQRIRLARIQEKNIRAAIVELRKRNFEASPAYRKDWDELIKSGDYNFPVNSEIVWNPNDQNDDHPSAKAKKEFPNGIRLFDVVTPIGFRPFFVKYHGRFKILILWPYPWD
jgi:hypothetical protein